MNIRIRIDINTHSTDRNAQNNMASSSHKQPVNHSGLQSQDRSNSSYQNSEQKDNEYQQKIQENYKSTHSWLHHFVTYLQSPAG